MVYPKSLPLVSSGVARNPKIKLSGASLSITSCTARITSKHNLARFFNESAP